MAVPKKRTSKAKTGSRKAHWRRKAFSVSVKALSLAKSSLTMRSNSYINVSKGLDLNKKSGV